MVTVPKNKNLALLAWIYWWWRRLMMVVRMGTCLFSLNIIYPAFFFLHFTPQTPKWEKRADENVWYGCMWIKINLCNRGRLLSSETTPFGDVLVKNQRRVNRTYLSSVSTLILSLQRNALPVLCTHRHLNTRWFAAQSLITSFSTELTLHSPLLIFHYGWGCGSTFTISTAIRDSVLVNRW